MRLWLISFAVLWIAEPCLAASCSPTPLLATSNYPGPRAIPSGNNLLLPVGKSVPASGQSLTISGQLLDRACVPILGATIELWQANPYGKWTLASAADIATPYPSFAGAGRAVTDNNGEFTFTTAFPGPVGARAPNLNLKIFARDMPDFSTVLFFANDQRNAGDAQYRQLSASSRQAVTLAIRRDDQSNALTGNITLVLPAKAPYRTF